ncbi:glycoside hydrolase family 24 protein [Piromyces sp. E2]|nr:glycoside hydrolase family 24 protein [Piromyces sp. E2]|eukprot:OUM70404.1 glycoside hydrolase family 24 protein [Piromyces sp. E2]
MKDYTVLKGDTLTSIAKKYSVPIGQICEVNCIKDINKIYAGQKLKIPEKNVTGIGTITKTSEFGRNFIKNFENLKLEAYQCPSGVWTIGWGHTKGVKEGDKITKAQAEELFNKDISIAEKAVNKYQKTYNFNKNQYDALVSFALNIGNIDELTSNGSRSIDMIRKKIPEYNKGRDKNNNKVILPGLVNRRKDELQLFNKK